MDHPTRYRDQGEQTAGPILQSQMTTVVDIPPQVTGGNPDPELLVPPPDSPNPPSEPEQNLEPSTSQSAEAENLRVVQESRPESTAQADPEPCNGLSIAQEPEATFVMRPDTAPDPLPADQTELDVPDDSSEVEVTNQNSHPDSGLIETLVGSQSTVPSPRRGTRLRKPPEQYAPVRRLQVLPVDRAEAGPSVWLFPTLGVAITLSAALPVAPLTF